MSRNEAREAAQRLLDCPATTQHARAAAHVALFFARRRHYFGWVGGGYRLVLIVGPYRPTIPWRRPPYDR